MVRFRLEKLSEKVTRINGIAGEQMYLVEGKKRAALIDTGCGVGSLKKCVEGLTEKPVIVLLTHGHMDHAMGAAEFEEVYINKKEEAIYQEHSALLMRHMFLAECPDYKDVEERDFQLPKRWEDMKELQDGDCFDLGDLTIDAFLCAGHTEGSMVFLIREERMILMGDACNGLTVLHGNSSLGIRSYKKSLQMMQERTSGKYDSLYIAHGPIDPPVYVVENVLKLCDKILNGADDKWSFQFLGMKEMLAKKIDAKSAESASDFGDIFYDPDRIFE